MDFILERLSVRSFSSSPEELDDVELDEELEELELEELELELPDKEVLSFI